MHSFNYSRKGSRRKRTTFEDRIVCPLHFVTDHRLLLRKRPNPRTSAIPLLLLISRKKTCKSQYFYSHAEIPALACLQLRSLGIAKSIYGNIGIYLLNYANCTSFIHWDCLWYSLGLRDVLEMQALLCLSLPQLSSLRCSRKNNIECTWEPPVTRIIVE